VADRLGRELGMTRLFLKLEYTCPSGSFKDRGSSLLLSKAKEIKASTVAIDSSGNAAASLAAYSARAGIPCYVFTPSYASVGKLVQAIANAAKVVKVDGTRRDTFEIAKIAIAKYGWYYCGFQVNPFPSEGSKTIGYEMCEQGGWEPPDVAVFPVGSGSGLIGCWKGLKEAKELGLVEKFSSMVCVQPEGCSPIASAFKQERSVIPVEKPKTIAEGLMIAEPLKGDIVLNALKESKGFAEVVSDKQIMDAAKLLAELEGVFVEPSAAASLAGMIKLLSEGKIDRDQKVACVLTGIGLKTLEAYSGAFAKPVTIKPIESEIERIVSWSS
jgi:threonine synthase